MTKGTLKHRTTGLEIPAALAFERKYDSKEYFNAIIDGENYSRSWDYKSWEFTPDKPSIQEQFDALPIGAAFVEGPNWLKWQPDNFYLKVDPDHVIFAGPGTSLEKRTKFDPDSSTWAEIIRKEIA